MSAPIEPAVRIQREDFDLAHESAALCAGRTDIGALVTFTGLCRDEAGTLAALELEHYPGMADAEIRRIARQAVERWPLSGLRVIHRYGKVRPGDNIVAVLAASRHRQAAFDAAAFMMDFLKTRAPFWKKEHRSDGSEGGWVEARDIDDEATQRWREPSAADR
ncbi:MULTISPECIES: molybdenum cofactor biosynthesis protein MoaE [Nitratireductor]|uniref:molybdenum cofactor biosynthesis protein MoaE n=1 Tax=Nitratireductor TaxID=245876 RepID=UPI000D0E1319|nr:MULTISPECIES: molybdenum cofactor biosynthesis protein MoaE [Nitratireductor]PSM17093.1 molybdopterin synthase catalytic subunit [Nitratireductor sp. StC3]